jgi:hypothetical protein
MLGVLSLGVGLVTLGATIAGVAGRPAPTWNEIRREPLVGAYVVVPSPTCIVAALAGDALGGAGLALGLRRRRLSRLCLAGVVLNYLCPWAGLARDLFLFILKALAP